MVNLNNDKLTRLADTSPLPRVYHDDSQQGGFFCQCAYRFTVMFSRNSLRIKRTWVNIRRIRPRPQFATPENSFFPLGFSPGNGLVVDPA